MRLASTIAFGLYSCFAMGQLSPFNGLALVPPDSTGTYRLVFGGHFHGASSNRSGFPAATVLANIDILNGLGANAFLSTGDLFLDADRDSARYARSLFAKMRVPLFNAPGNHDVEGRTYTRSYGPTHMVLAMGADRIMILDTERDNGDVIGDQLQALERLTQEFNGRRVFIVSHRPIWAEGEPIYGSLFEGNTRSAMGTNFKGEVLPLLRTIAAKAEVFWISGSMAGGAPSSIFFQPHEPNLTYIQCAVRDEPRDALLVVDVVAGNLSWSALSLTGQSLGAVAQYDAAWWKAHKRGASSEHFNMRLIPLYVRNISMHKAFWYGAICAIALLLVFRHLSRRG